MKNYAEMSDFEINKAVLSILSTFPVHPKPKRGSSAAGAAVSTHSILHWYDYCNSWSEAGPVIESNGISLQRDAADRWLSNTDVEIHYAISDKPLRAAMIAFLMMHEND